jgi:hypothetical protein
MQATVANDPTYVYEGKGESSIHDKFDVTGFASARIYFGKAVMALATALTNEKVVTPPSSAGHIALLQGIALADISKETPDGQAFGCYDQYDAVTVRRKGRVWVQVTRAVAALSDPVYVKVGTPGGSPPLLALGSLNTEAADGTWSLWDGPVWRAAVTVGARNYGLLELNMP